MENYTYTETDCDNVTEEPLSDCNTSTSNSAGTTEYFSSEAHSPLGVGTTRSCSASDETLSFNTDSLETLQIPPQTCTTKTSDTKNEIDYNDQGRDLPIHEHPATRELSCTAQILPCSSNKDHIVTSQEDIHNANQTEHLQPNVSQTSAPLYTCLQPLDLSQIVTEHMSDKVLCIAPGEGQELVSVFDTEGKAFATLFPDGTNTFNQERPVKISAKRYFNARLFSYDTRFAQNAEYIFFAQYTSELSEMLSSISIAMRKGTKRTSTGQTVTAFMLQNKESVRQILSTDDGYYFMKKIRGTPAYWECTMRDLFAMVRQLGIPTWFCSFSAADRRWPEIDEAILEQQGKPIPDTIDWETHCKIIASNPVTATRMFEHRVQSFINHVILSPAQPIGHVIDYFYRVEFQQRGWPHIHCLFWVKDAPLYGQSPIEEIEQFIDHYISCKLPSESMEPQLYEKVQNLQMHSKNHSRSCKKGSKTCRFHFPRVPSQRTFISKPKSQDSGDEETVHGFSTAVQKLWDCILNDTLIAHTIDEAFHKAGITQEQLEYCIRSKTKKETAFLKRQPADIWVNNYNPTLLQAWNANMDIQFVLDAYSCIMYIVSYISKSEREMGDLLKASQQEAREGNVKPMEELRKLGSVYLNHREVSVMEAVYRVTGMHMKQCSRQVVFIPTDPDCQRLSMPLHEMRNKQEDTDNIWLSNLVDKYLERPEQLRDICLATFASEYRYAGQHSTSKHALTLGNGLGTIIKRTNKDAIIRYPKVRIQKDTEKYYSNLIRLYSPTRQKELTPGIYTSFENYFLHASYNGTPVKEVIANNMRHFEPLAVELEMLWESMQANPNQENSWADLAPQNEMERIEQTEHLLQTVDC